MQDPKMLVHAILLLLIVFLSGTLGIGILHSAASFSKCLSLGKYNADFLKFGDCNMLCPKQQINSAGIINAKFNYSEIRFVSDDTCISTYESGGEGWPVIPFRSVSMSSQNWQIVDGNADKKFQLMVQKSQRCLTANGASAIELRCNKTNEYQFWIWEDASQPFNMLESVANPYKCLRPKSSIESSSTTEISTCDYSDFGQLKRIVQNGDFKRIQSVLLGKCLQESQSTADYLTCQPRGSDQYQKWSMFSPYVNGWVLKGSGVYDGNCLATNPTAVVMQQYDETSFNPKQLWIQRSAAVYLLKVYNVDPSVRKCVYAVNNDRDLKITDCHRLNFDQHFRIANWANGFGYLQVNGKCVSTYTDSVNVGISIIRWDCIESTNQYWSIYTDTSNRQFMRFKNKYTGKCLTLKETDATAHQEVCENAAFGMFQRFVLEKYQ